MDLPDRRAAPWKADIAGGRGAHWSDGADHGFMHCTHRGGTLADEATAGECGAARDSRVAGRVRRGGWPVDDVKDKMKGMDTLDYDELIIGK